MTGTRLNDHGIALGEHSCVRLAIKANAPIPESITFLQDRITDERVPSNVGSEYVLFLSRQTKGLVKSPYMTGGFLVRAGTVQPLHKDGWERYDGMKLSDLLAELRQLTAAK